VNKVILLNNFGAILSLMEATKENTYHILWYKQESTELNMAYMRFLDHIDKTFKNEGILANIVYVDIKPFRALKYNDQITNNLIVNSYIMQTLEDCVVVDTRAIDDVNCDYFKTHVKVEHQHFTMMDIQYALLASGYSYLADFIILNEYNGQVQSIAEALEHGLYKGANMVTADPELFDKIYKVLNIDTSVKL
jgi:hypothetical protein